MDSRVERRAAGLSRSQLGRGDVLLSPDSWCPTALVDVRCTIPTASDSPTVSELPGELVLHLGTAAVPVRFRPLGSAQARLTVSHPLSVKAGDRLVLHDAGRHAKRQARCMSRVTEVAGGCQAWKRFSSDHTPWPSVWAANATVH